jgi:Flp pilus assembly CpaE family ATPase
MLIAHLDIQPEYSIENLISYNHELDVRVVEQALTRVTDNLFVLAGPRRPISTSAQVSERMATILDYLRHLGSMIVLDIPCTFDDLYFELLHRADRVVLVGQQSIPSIRSVQLVLDSLGRKESRNKYQLVLNRYEPDREGFTAPDLEKLLRLPKVLTLANDPARVMAALNQGKPLRLASPRSPVLRDMETLCHSLLDHVGSSPTLSSTPGVFGRLFHALRLA